MATLAYPYPMPTQVNVDRIEAEAFAEIYRLCPDSIRRAYGVETHSWPGGIAFGAPGADLLYFNRAIVLEPEAITVAALNDLREWYDALQTRRFFVQVSPASTDAHVALASAGMTPFNKWVKMRRDDTPAPDFPTSLSVEEVGPATAEAFAEVLTRCFDWPPAFVGWISRLPESPRWRCYVARDTGRVVASGAMYLAEDTAALGPAATLPEGRGRGAQTALVRRRLEDALSTGIRQFVTETGEDTAERPSPSYRNMLRLGFTVTCLRDNYITQL